MCKLENKQMLNKTKIGEDPLKSDADNKEGELVQNKADERGGIGMAMGRERELASERYSNYCAERLEKKNKKIKWRRSTITRKLMVKKHDSILRWRE